jgi:hypothetical protein
MSGFPPTCFHREPRNLRACTKVPAAVAAALAVLPALTIVDFACDTGSMLRALAPHPPALQNADRVRFLAKTARDRRRGAALPFYAELTYHGRIPF